MGCDIHPYAEVRIGGQWKAARIKLPNDRNYWAFGKLANVRNGSGFAGADMGDAVRPIDQPRGLPIDTAIADTGEVIEYDDPAYVWLGDHSHSWVLLSELLAIDLDAMVTQRGMVSAEQASEFRKTGNPPDSYCGWTNREDYVKIQWQEPLRESAWLLPKIIAALVPLGKPEDVRLVFGFDS